MIKVERLNDSEFYLNPHQIEFIESTPDTVITLLSGKKLVVKDKVEDLVRRIGEYRRLIGNSMSGNED